MAPVWTGTTVHEGRVVFRVGREGDTLIAEWPGIAVLHVDRAGKVRASKRAGRY